MLEVIVKGKTNPRHIIDGDSSADVKARPMDEGARLLHAIQDVYLCEGVTVA